MVLTTSRACFVLKFLCLWLIIIFVVGHSVSIYLYSKQWVPLAQLKGRLKDPAIVLLVADSHILGYKQENFITRWESDRYLAPSFRRALHLYSPNMVVFLGDVFDEASVAQPNDKILAKRRFKEIYLDGLRDFNTSIFALPGDNDIGGEHDELISVDTISSFQDMTGFNENMTKVKFFHIFKLDIFDVEIDPDALSAARLLSNQPNICVSHTPLLVDTFRPLSFAVQVFNSLRCHVVFSAHFHSSFMSVFNTRNRNPETAVKSRNLRRWGESVEVTMTTSNMYEFHVPAATYRSGTPWCGFGVAAIGKDRAHYAVLWLPDSVAILGAYVVLPCIILLVILVLVCVRERKLRHIYLFICFIIIISFISIIYLFI